MKAVAVLVVVVNLFVNQRSKKFDDAEKVIILNNTRTIAVDKIYVDVLTGAVAFDTDTNSDVSTTSEQTQTLTRRRARPIVK